jgi:hypothetical protein
MMVARQALFGRVCQHAADHAAQRLLGQKVIADLVSHGGSAPLMESQDASAATTSRAIPVLPAHSRIVING